MRIANIGLLGYCLLAFIAFAGFYLWAFKQRRIAREKFAKQELLKELLLSVDFRLQKLKAVVIILGVTLMLFSLLRPQWGFRWEEIKRKGVDILIALDSSKSMLAEDVLPSRLQRAKLSLKDLTRQLKGDRIGLIAFSGTAFLQCPLTVDYGGFLLSLDNIDSNTIPRGGTSFSSAIQEAIKGYAGGQKKYKVLVIISDGENLEGDPLKLAEVAKNEGIIIHCIGIGTKDGELIFTQESGNREYVKDKEGNAVKSRLDETLLQKIALATGGSYIRATSKEFGLSLLYEERISKMEKRELEGHLAKNYQERFQWPLALGFLFLLLEPFIPERKKIN